MRVVRRASRVRPVCVAALGRRLSACGAGSISGYQDASQLSYRLGQRRMSLVYAADGTLSIQQ